MVTDMSSTTQAQPRLGPFWMILFSTLVGGAILATGTEEHVRAAVIAVVLTFLMFFVFRRAAISEPEASQVFTLLVLAWLLKMGAVALRLYLIIDVYATGDALAYHAMGQQVASDLDAGALPDTTRFWGTRFVELATGLLYFVTGPTMVGAFLLFAFLGLIGLLLHYKAFVIAFPEGDHRLFRMLVLLYPSLVFWTSSLGKDALIALPLGMLAYSVATIYRRGLTLSSLALMGLALGGILLIRPHVAAIAAVGVFAAAVLQPRWPPFVRLAGLILFSALAVVMVRTSASFIGLEDLSVEGVVEFAGEAQVEGGGSTVSGGGLPTSPQALAMAIPGVLFRPFPWEAGSLFLKASAAEGAFLFGLIVLRYRSVFRAIAEARRHAYLAFVLLFTVLFIFFFSTINNFGILARQRAQLLPFIFVFVAFQRALGKDATEPNIS